MKITIEEFLELSYYNCFVSEGCTNCKIQQHCRDATKIEDGEIEITEEQLLDLLRNTISYIKISTKTNKITERTQNGRKTAQKT